MFDSIKSFVPKSMLKDFKPKDPTRDLGLYPILKADALFKLKRRKALVEKFPSQIGLTPELYKELCHQTLENFAEFVQSLPETRNGYYSYNGGVLDHGLERASIAVSLARSYHFRDDANKALTKEDKNALWVYAVFTAALLFDLGKVAVNQVITLCDKYGSDISIWSPVTGSMLKSNASHFKVEFEKENREDLKRRLTSLLAEKLIPPEGYQWIASDKDVLDAWLAMLNDDKRGRGSLINLIPIADAKAIEKFYQEIKAQLVGEELAFGLDKEELTDQEKELLEKQRKEKKAEAKEGVEEEKEVGLDEEFFDWLREGIEKGRLSVNEADSLIQIVNEEAALKYPEIINRFLSDKGIQDRTVQDVHKAITNSELTKRDFANRDVQQFKEVKQYGDNKSYLVVQNKFSLFKAEAGAIRTIDARAPVAELPMIMRVPAAAFYNVNALAQIIAPSASPGGPSGR